jgi:hypothetical protein
MSWIKNPGLPDRQRSPGLGGEPGDSQGANSPGKRFSRPARRAGRVGWRGFATRAANPNS